MNYKKHYYNGIINIIVTFIYLFVYFYNLIKKNNNNIIIRCIQIVILKHVTIQNMKAIFFIDLTS